METLYVVQSYFVGVARRIEPDPPREVDTEEQAVELAKRLMKSKIGVIAYSRTIDKADDWDDAKVLYQDGDMTPEDAATLRLVG